MAENNIFGFGAFANQFWSLIKGKVPFYPLFQNFFMNRKLPIYVDMNNLMLVYLSIPMVRTIIDKKAEMTKNARFCVYKIGNEDVEIENHPILALLNNPNPLQNSNDFVSQFSTFKDIYANAFIRKVKASSVAYPKVLYNLPPGEMKIIPTGKLFDQIDLEGIIDKYVLFNSGQFAPIEYTPREVLHISSGTSDKYFFAESKLLTNKMIISNFNGAYKTRNLIINDRGALGILSSTGKEGTGAIPFGKTERDQIAESYKKEYGIEDDQKKILMTASALKWQPMSFPTSELMLFEEVEENFSMFCSAYGMDRGLFATGTKGNASKGLGRDAKGAMEESLKVTYQNCIQQEIDAFCEVFNRDPDFGLISKGYILKASFAHLPVMQENELDKETVQSEKTVSLSQMLKDGIISKQEYREMMGIEGQPPAETEAPAVATPKQIQAPLTPEEQAAQDQAQADETQKAIKTIAANGHMKKIFA